MREIGQYGKCVGVGVTEIMAELIQKAEIFVHLAVWVSGIRGNE